MSLFCPRSNLLPPPPESFAAMEYSLERRSRFTGPIVQKHPSLGSRPM
jgi:hypothetical protein